MGAEIFVDVGPWTCLGWLLDAQRALACADRVVAGPRLFRPGVESTRPALLRVDRSVLDRSPVIEHLPRLLHGSVPTSPARTADPVRAGEVGTLPCNRRGKCSITGDRSKTERSTRSKAGLVDSTPGLNSRGPATTRSAQARAR